MIGRGAAGAIGAKPLELLRQLARAAALHQRPHPNYLPWNIYGTTGDWETWSTPSRDAALKVVVRDLRDTAAAQPEGSPLRADFAVRLADSEREEASRRLDRWTLAISSTLYFGIVIALILRQR